MTNWGKAISKVALPMLLAMLIVGAMPVQAIVLVKNINTPAELEVQDTAKVFGAVDTECLINDELIVDNSDSDSQLIEVSNSELIRVDNIDNLELNIAQDRFLVRPTDPVEKEVIPSDNELEDTISDRNFERSSRGTDNPEDETEDTGARSLIRGAGGYDVSAYDFDLISENPVAGRGARLGEPITFEWEVKNTGSQITADDNLWVWAGVRYSGPLNSDGGSFYGWGCHRSWGAFDVGEVETYTCTVTIPDDQPVGDYDFWLDVSITNRSGPPWFVDESNMGNNRYPWWGSIEIQVNSQEGYYFDECNNGRGWSEPGLGSFQCTKADCCGPNQDAHIHGFGRIHGAQDVKLTYSLGGWNGNIWPLYAYYSTDGETWTEFWETEVTAKDIDAEPTLPPSNWKKYSSIVYVPGEFRFIKLKMTPIDYSSVDLQVGNYNWQGSTTHPSRSKHLKAYLESKGLVYTQPGDYKVAFRHCDLGRLSGTYSYGDESTVTLDYDKNGMLDSFKVGSGEVDVKGAILMKFDSGWRNSITIPSPEELNGNGNFDFGDGRGDTITKTMSDRFLVKISLNTTHDVLYTYTPEITYVGWNGENYASCDISTLPHTTYAGLTDGYNGAGREVYEYTATDGSTQYTSKAVAVDIESPKDYTCEAYCGGGTVTNPDTPQPRCCTPIELKYKEGKTVTVTAVASGLDYIQSHAWKVDGTTVSTKNYGGNYQRSIRVTSDFEDLAPGQHNITFEAKNNLGFVMGRSIIVEIIANVPPDINVTEPDGLNDFVNNSFEPWYEIKWDAEDPDDNARIYLYYDTDNVGFDGTLIDAGYNWEDYQDSYWWDTPDLPDGNYWIYAVINDSKNPAVYDYSEGPVTVYTDVPPVNIPPTITVVEPDGVGDNADASYRIEWVDSDPDDDASISLFYSNDSNFTSGTLIVAGISEDSLRDSYLWDTSALANGDYYVYAKIDDSVNPVVYDWNYNPVTVLHVTPPANSTPAIMVTQPDGLNDIADISYLIEWIDVDPDDDASISLYYDTDATGYDGTLIVAGLSEDSAVDSHLWGTAALPNNTQYYVYAKIDDGVNAPVYDYSAGPVTIVHADPSPNTPPTITIIEPDGVGDSADTSFNVTWTDSDPDNNAQISLYYDTDNIGYDGTLIQSGISEDAANWNLWDTTLVPNGDYYVYAIINDGVNPNVYDYSDGPVTILHAGNQPPTINVTEPDGIGDIADLIYTITWTDSDPDDDASISLYYDTDATGYDGTLIVAGLSENSATDNYVWNTAGLPNNTQYYVYAKIDDGINAPVYDYSDGPVNITHVGPTNMSPAIAIVEPDGVGDNADTSFNITWVDVDPDDDAQISLYYDIDNTGYDGTLIVSGLSEDSAVDYYIWDTTLVPNGLYYVYGVIDDSVNAPVYDYSAGPVNITHAAPNNPPSVSNVVIIPVPAYTTDTLTGTGVYSDPDSDPESGSAFKWYKNGVEIAGETTTTLASSNFVKGNQIVFEYTPSDGMDFGTPVNSSALTISNTAPVAVIDSPVAGNYTVGTNILFNASSSSDVDMDVLTYTWVSSINGSIGTTVAFNLNTLNLGMHTITLTVDDGDGGNDNAWVQINIVTGNTSPSITVTEPDGLGDIADASYTIQWTDSDPDDDAQINLYYDTDSSGFDGTLIVAGLSENSATDSHVWNTAGLPNGTSYYIYAMIDDGINPPVYDYSDGPVTILHGVPPNNNIILNSVVEGTYYASLISPNDIILNSTNVSGFSLVKDSNIGSSNITSSTVINSTVNKSIISNKLVADTYVSNTEDPKGKLIGSKIEFSKLKKSDILYSNVSYSEINNSTVEYSDISNMTIWDAYVSYNVLKSGCLTHENNTYCEATLGEVDLGDIYNYKDPLAEAGADQTLLNGSVVTLDGSMSTGSIVLYEWDFEGDGVYDWSSTTTSTIQHIYPTTGAYMAKLRVTGKFFGVQDIDGTIIVLNKTVGVNNPPSVTVDVPNSGETWKGTKSIQWTATDPDGDNLIVGIDYSPDNGATWNTIAALGEFNDGNYAWDTTTVSDGASYLIRVYAYDGNVSVGDNSDGTFTIDNSAGPVIIIDGGSPGGGGGYVDKPILFNAEIGGGAGLEPVPPVEIEYGVSASVSDSAFSMNAGESEIITLLVENLGTGRDVYSIQLLGPDWISAGETSFGVSSHGTRTLLLTFSPGSDVEGEFPVTAIVRSRNNDAQSVAVITVTVEGAGGPGTPITGLITFMGSTAGIIVGMIILAAIVLLGTWVSLSEGSREAIKSKFKGNSKGKKAEKAPKEKKATEEKAPKEKAEKK